MDYFKKIIKVVKKPTLINSYDIEPDEFCNFFYNEVYKCTKTPFSSNRILLIGDSTARQIRNSFAEIIKKPVDLFATSAAVRDELFWSQFKCFLDHELFEPSYSCIYIWIGFHSRLSEDGTFPFKEEDYIRFENKYKSLVEACKKMAGRVILIESFYRYIPTPLNIIDRIPLVDNFRRRLLIKRKTILDETHTEVIRRKNAIIKKIAEQEQLPFLPINEIMMNSKYWVKDKVHYINEANKYMSEILKRYSQN